MSAVPSEAAARWRWFWPLAFTGLALYVAARLGVFALAVEVPAPGGAVRIPNTFASVDHPFHVARAETLWRELASGRVLRWIGQHQGGYPVEFYPLGEAWLEVLVRAASFGALSVQGAHTLAIVILFLLPGAAYAAFAKTDRWPLVVGFTALALHVSLPGGWYHGGYTELVQWGLVTNVAGSVAALLTLPPLLIYLRCGKAQAGALAALLASWALYCNPRSIVGLGALAVGALVTVATMRDKGSAPAIRGKREFPVPGTVLVIVRRLSVVALAGGLLAAPLLLALVRFGGLYAFVHYSGYQRLGDYVAESLAAVSLPVLALGLVGAGIGLTTTYRLSTRAAAISLLVYAFLTAAIAFVPWVSRLAPQLEPTRLMPLQRLLIIYLAAVAIWTILDALIARFAALPRALAPFAAAGVALAFLIVQTRSVAGPAPDPASGAIPPRGLYPVAMSARTQQFDFELAVRAADEAAETGTALLVMGSALSWHQQLWAPLWTSRPLVYDNWLWYWHPNHAGTPGYRFSAGHHYPDPEAALEPGYLKRHGVGGVVVTGPARETASRSPHLEPVRAGVYDAYAVRDPVTSVTFGTANAALLDGRNQSIGAVAQSPGSPIVARTNWHPRWTARADEQPVEVARLDSGYVEAVPAQPALKAEFTYETQPLDWFARVMAIAGIAVLVWMVQPRGGPNHWRPGWYSRFSRAQGASRSEAGMVTKDRTVTEHLDA